MSPPVAVMGRWIRFFISSTDTPASGPTPKAAIRAGRSEKSYFRNEGTTGTENSRYIKAADRADSTAVTTRRRT